jgi:hypothetical protein
MFSFHRPVFLDISKKVRMLEHKGAICLITVFLLTIVVAFVFESPLTVSAQNFPPLVPFGNNTKSQQELAKQTAATATSTLSNEQTGMLTIKKVIVGTEKLLANATFRITPNPFTLRGSLVVHDNNITLDSDSRNGIILLKNVRFSSYLINETKNPLHFGPILLKARITVHQTNPHPIVLIENRDLRIPFVGPARVTAPYLNDSSLHTFFSKGATIGGVPINRVDQLPPALIVTSEKQIITSKKILPPPSKPITFTAGVPVTSPVSQIFKSFQMPTYPAPVKDIASHLIYVTPAFKIRQQGSNNNFTLTPIIARIFPGMSLLMNQSSAVASGLASVEEIKLRFAEQGSNVGFGFGVSDTVPSSLSLPKIPIGTLALFLNIGFVGQAGGTKKIIEFSNSSSFASSPEINIFVNKSLNTTKLSDGCPNITTFFFNENLGKWQILNKPIRDPARDTMDKCSYTIETGHFSKFAVGGIKPPEVLSLTNFVLKKHDKYIM